LESSDAMVVLISAAAAKSPHTRQEIEYALSQPRFADRLIPVEVEKTADMPWILKRMHPVSAKNPVEAGEAVAKVLADRLEVTTA